MSLIKCLECKKKISDKAECCPNCGCPQNKQKDSYKPTKEKQQQSGNFLLKFFIWFVIAIVIFALSKAYMISLAVFLISLLILLLIRKDIKAKYLSRFKLKYLVIVILITLFGIHVSISTEQREEQERLAKIETKKRNLEEARKKKIAGEKEQAKQIEIQKTKRVEAQADLDNDCDRAIEFYRTASDITPEEKIGIGKCKIKLILSKLESGNYQSSSDLIDSMDSAIIKNEEVIALYKNNKSQSSLPPELALSNLSRYYKVVKEFGVNFDQNPRNLSYSQVIDLAENISILEREGSLRINSTTFWNNFAELILITAIKIDNSNYYLNDKKKKAIKLINIANTYAADKELDSKLVEKIRKFKESATILERIDTKTRKAIFGELVELERKARELAEKKYPTTGLYGEDFAPMNDKQIDENRRLEAIYEAELRKKYSITENELSTIMGEGVQKSMIGGKYKSWSER